MKTSVRMQMPGFPPPWLLAWFNLHARKTLLKRICVFLIAWLLSWVLAYIRPQRESSNKGDWWTYRNPLTKVHALYVCLQSKFHLYVHLL